MKFRSLGTALATAALIGTALTGTVATAGMAAAATTPDCSSALTNVKPKETVNLRSSPKTSATALGTWGKGAKGGICTSDGKPVKGGSYTACGKTSDKWFYGGPDSSSVEGWVPATCLPI
ncbi:MULTISPECIES: hypothetical protein [unclassified Streptomyces]|uniref:hypothetical protein n=1 Tax=unclassified Streptomyces TaxID=2593676 RepID=UPI00225C3B59|nr:MULTISPECIES: hypothetical protein [unclassified Streptomyces]MCX5050450.1 hypothetical protein [Streptomyces sp. NBC_00474]MCX5060827.1 hypothetical protein [Streptomyces sp. NBC_00452]MCX5293548.1 hypothetical protein [Streptomyces sp. NBC_00183]